MLPGDRLVCAFVRPVSIGQHFKEWPLHVTIVPWYRLPETSKQIADGLREALKTVKSFEAVVNETALFGPHKNRPALLVTQPNNFELIEEKVRGYLHKKRAWLVDETTKRKHPFKAHVTSQPSDKLRVGDSFLCDTLYIVEQKGPYKEIIEEILL